jgi:beta-lactamase superfamily II metal-dependent hydrolase
MGDTRCPICKQPVVAKLTDTLLAQGMDDATIVATLKSAGVERVGPLSVSKHRQDCREDSVEVAQFSASPKSKTDFAAMVRDRAIVGLESGELSVTTQHGLQAQQIIEAREAKAKDRGLMLALARVLGGMLPPPSVVVYEGGYTELEASKPELIEA